MRQFVIFIASLLIFFAIFFQKGYSQTIQTDLLPQERARLESELAELEKQIEGFRSVILDKQKDRTSLERDVAILDAQIQKSRLEIKARNLTIQKLSASINSKSQLISELTVKTEREKASLAELLRRINELDGVSLVEAMLSYDTISDFFIDADNFDEIQEALQGSINDIRQTQMVISEERGQLEARKSQELQLKTIQELEKKRIEEREEEKQRLLKETKGQEEAYKKILADRQKDAAKIRSQLFLLRGSKAIPFEEAAAHANYAYQLTGVRPAFLLGIIAEESNLGENVGTGNWQTDLSHSRCTKQREAFLQITSELGLDPNAMPVSRKTWYGYCGGAMGPAQFIPTTWLLYKDTVAKITGVNPPNPWDPRTAFVASALLLKDNGAAAGTYQAERRAALRYLAGSNWSNPSYAFYGDDVMALAQKYQEQIDIISR